MSMMYEQRLSLVNVGDTIPEMDLVAYDPKSESVIKINTSSYRGKWLVIVFYPADFTFVCPTELKELALLYDDFMREDAEIIAVSTDSVFSHKAWHDKSEDVRLVRFPMASDTAGRFASYFGVYDEKAGTAFRGTFVVDTEGTIATSEVNNGSIGRSAKETLRKLRASKYVFEHPGDLCPASWEPGDEPLHPAGNIIAEK